MRVHELIEALLQHDPDAIVVMEGCDCWGTAGDVESNVGCNEVLITRED